VRRADLAPRLDELSPSRRSRQLHRLREIGVIKKLVASYRYYPTKIGRAAIAAVGHVTQSTIIPALA
jgi:DNA-binding Lrp family transcriptional regulator